MNCFNEDTLQKYIDGECDHNEHVKIEAHIEGCADCKTIVANFRKRSETIKKQLNTLVNEIPEVPEMPSFINEKPVVPLRKKFVYGIAAASILLLITLLLGDIQSPQNEETMMYYNIDYEIDANKPLTEQEMVFYITDENGLAMENN